MRDWRRIRRRNIAVAAQIQEMAIGVQQSVVTVDQNAERNAVEKSWREQLLLRRLGCIKRLFAYRVRCWFVRGVARFLVLTLAFAAAVLVRFLALILALILPCFLAQLFAWFLAWRFAELWVVLLIERLAQNLPQLVLAQGPVLARGQFLGHGFGGY